MSHRHRCCAVLVWLTWTAVTASVDLAQPNSAGRVHVLTRSVQDYVLLKGSFNFRDTTFNVNGTFAIIGGTAAFARCTLNVQGDLYIDSSTVNFTGCVVSLVLQRDQQYAVSIYGGSAVTIDSTLMQGTGYQTEFRVRARNGLSPAVAVRNHSRCRNHAGFGSFNRSSVVVMNADIGEVQAHDSAQIRIQNGSAYPVLFYPPGTYSIADLHAGAGISRTIQIPSMWNVTIQNVDSSITGYQLDLFTGTTLTASRCTDIVLSVHTPGKLSRAVTVSGLTPGFVTSDSLVGLGPQFTYTQSRISLFNIYTFGNDTVLVHGMSVNELEAHDRSLLVIGGAPDTTYVACNLLQTMNRGEIRLVNAIVRADNESEPSALASDSSRIVFQNSDLRGLKIGGEQFSRIYISGCRHYADSLTRLFDSARVFFTLPTSVKEFAPAMPTQYNLLQNFPNPFNPSTTIRCTIPSRSQVTLKVYDMLGREVATLVDGQIDAGLHQSVLDARRFASGVYFYRLQAHPVTGGQSGLFVETKKLLLLK